MNSLNEDFNKEIAEFDLMIGREFIPRKPYKDGSIHISNYFNLDSEEVLFVGDSIDDLKCAESGKKNDNKNIYFLYIFFF